MLVTILTDATAAFWGVTHLSQAWNTPPSGQQARFYPSPM